METNKVVEEWSKRFAKRQIEKGNVKFNALGNTVAVIAVLADKVGLHKINTWLVKRITNKPSRYISIDEEACGFFENIR